MVIMKLRHPTARIPLLIAIGLSLLACSLFTSSAAAPATLGASGELEPSVAAPALATAEAVETPAGSVSTAEAAYDLSQAGLPPGFPIYPGGGDFSGLPGIMLMYTVDADVRTASAFYDEKMKADGWSGYSTGGAAMGECGGDCGPVPTKTPGPGPTATPEGWMHENIQFWTKESQQVNIEFAANPSGGTDITIAFSGQ